MHSPNCGTDGCNILKVYTVLRSLVECEGRKKLEFDEQLLSFSKYENLKLTACLK
jgi:hypothetical protein